MSDLVSNAPYRMAFSKSGLSLNECSRRMGVSNSTVGRALGLWILTDVRRGKQYRNKRMRVETAVKFIQALDVDPNDMGL